MYLMGANDMHGEKVWWELSKNSMCCFDHILEAAPHKTAAVQWFTSHFTNPPIRWTIREGHSWKSKDELISDVLIWTPTHGHTSFDTPTRFYIHQLCAHTGCSQADLPRMIDWDGWQESGNSVLLVWLEDDDDDDDYCLKWLTFIDIATKYWCIVSRVPTLQEPISTFVYLWYTNTEHDRRKGMINAFVPTRIFNLLYCKVWLRFMAYQTLCVIRCQILFIYTHTHTHTHTYIYIYIYIGVYQYTWDPCDC